MSVEGTRKFKMEINPYLPQCQKCPWILWCTKLNFRTNDPKTGKPIRVCPMWWMLTENLREKGIVKAPLPAPPPVGSEEARAMLELMRRQRVQGLGRTAA